MGIDFAQYIADINATASAEEAFDILQRSLAGFGFDRVVYSLITDHPTLNQKQGHGILRNYPEDWMKYHFAKDYFNVDPVIKQIRQTNMPFVWKELDALRFGMRKDERLLMDEASEAKLLDGVGLSFHGECGEIVGMGVASSAGGADLDRNTVSMVYALCAQFHITYRHKEALYAPPVVKLSARELEVLHWTAEGKSRSCIAQILRLSDETVKTYIGRIFIKLKVNSMQLAVVKAIALGLISPGMPQVLDVKGRPLSPN